MPTLKFSAGDTEGCSGKPTGGIYPKYEQVIPTYKSTECTSIGFDGKLLVELLNTMLQCKLGGCTDEGLENRTFEFVVPHDSTRPMVIHSRAAGNPTKGTGVLMPCGLAIEEQP